MKCPKCGYISFDYNQVCPKCNKNISSEQEKIFLPSFRPDPPSLLGFLTGEANESNVNLHGQQGTRIDRGHGDDLNLSDSAILNSDGFGVDGNDLDMSFEPEDSGEDLFEKELAAEPEKLFSDSDFSLEDKKDDEIFSTPEIKDEEESPLSLDDFSLEESEGFISELSLDDSEETSKSIKKEIEFDDADLSLDALESLPAEIENGGDEIESEIELNLDDLKVSDLGDLEIGTGLEMEASERELEGTLVEPDRDSDNEDIQGLVAEDSDLEMDLVNLPDLSDLIPEEEASAGKERTIILSKDFALNETDSTMQTDGFELSDIPLEISESEEDSLDLEGYNLDASDSGEMGKPMSLDDLSLNDSGELEKSFDLSDISLDDYPDHDQELSGESISDNDDIDIDLDAMSLDVEEYQKKPGSRSDDFVLDLEDMDIDLDLDEPKK